VAEIDRILVSIEQVPENMASLIEKINPTEAEIKEMLKIMVGNNPAIFGAAIAYEPYWNNEKEYYYSFYAFRQYDSITLTILGKTGYDYFMMDWYQIPKETRHPYWTEPYFDEGGGEIVMSTYSVPFYLTGGGARRMAGIITADISLDWLRNIVDSVRVYQTGFGFIITQTGSIVSHPRKELIMNASIFSIAEETNNPELREMGRKMTRGQTGYSSNRYRNQFNNKESLLAYAPVPSNGWSFGVILPVDEFMAEAYHLYRMIIILGITGLIFIFLVILFISRSITRPLRKLTHAADSFARGNFDVDLPETRSKDEIGRLTGSFSFMQKKLGETITRLKVASEQLRISNEKLEEYNRTLEQKVQERTAELVNKNQELDSALKDLTAAQAQLVQSEKLASLGQLTAGIAHEIKNPLNFVNNFSELSLDLANEILEELEKPGDVPEDPKETGYLKELISDLRENCKKINEHGKRADSIIRGMLLHSRGKSGEFQPTDINTLLAEYAGLSYHGMRATDPSFNIKIEADYDPSLGKVDVVPQDLSRVFLNIINNACQSTHQKKKEMKESYFPVLNLSTKKEGEWVVIRIRDNGKGIPATVMDKIFNPFFTTKPAGSGTGLGLSISFDIVVREHHGEIRADSEEGEFAEFIIRIPVKSS
jgi:signal transduction histidine kinase